MFYSHGEGGEDACPPARSTKAKPSAALRSPRRSKTRLSALPCCRSPRATLSLPITWVPANAERRTAWTNVITRTASFLDRAVPSRHRRLVLGTNIPVLRLHSEGAKLDAGMDPQRRVQSQASSPWETPYRAIGAKIGEELRERLKLPQELPENLAALLKQITAHGNE